MKQLVIVILLFSSAAYAQCPPGMSTNMCNAWDYHTTPQQRRMDQGLPPVPPTRSEQERLNDNRRFFDLHDPRNQPAPSNAAPWFQQCRNLGQC
jgi:hypothetical protein